MGEREREKCVSFGECVFAEGGVYMDGQEREREREHRNRKMCVCEREREREGEERERQRERAILSVFTSLLQVFWWKEVQTATTRTVPQHVRSAGCMLTK